LLKKSLPKKSLPKRAENFRDNLPPRQLPIYQPQQIPIYQPRRPQTSTIHQTTSGRPLYQAPQILDDPIANAAKAWTHGMQYK
jgi:hypothetical protein